MREHRLAMGRPADGTLVFPGDDGKPISAHGRPRAAWRRIIKEATLAGAAPTWHDLRHTYASQMLSSGKSREVVAELLGHETTDLVAERYGPYLALSPGLRGAVMSRTAERLRHLGERLLGGAAKRPQGDSDAEGDRQRVDDARWRGAGAELRR
jgi:integrase